MRKVFFVAVVAIAVCSCTTVRLTPDEHDALKVLRRYLYLDKNAAPTGAERSVPMLDLVVWETEPAWDTVLVVSGWTMGRPQFAGGKVTATVRYDIAGVMAPGEFVPAETSDTAYLKIIEENRTIAYTLVPASNGWKIESPVTMPHIGFAAARKSQEELGHENVVQALDDAEYIAKLKGQRAGHCNCERQDF